MPTLLIVDDEINVLYSFQKSLQSETLRVVTASTGQEGIDKVRLESPDAVILDVRLPDICGLDVFRHIRAVDPRVPVIVITAFTTTETAIEAMQRGAFDYLLKPVDFRQLRSVVHRALEVSRLSRVPAVVDDQEPALEPLRADRIIGQSPPMQEVYKAIGRVAGEDITVLITGESGTGKELVARAIYHYSRRSQMPFLAINCAAIPETLLESELFGHEQGAFTGADRRRIGKFEQAHGGTILLDEIADMTPATQAKVLRLLQEQRFQRIGSNDTVQTDVRVLAATNQDLEGLVENRGFRRDLLYRLNTLTIHLPPLRDRPGDLPLLVDHFVQVFNQQLGHRVRVVTPEALDVLSHHAWPGNVRELQGVIKYAMVHSTGEVLTAAALPELGKSRKSSAASPRPESPAPTDELYPGVVRLIQSLLRDQRGEVYRLTHAEIDRVLFTEILADAGGNQQEAAEILGISRTTLRAKLRALGLSVGKQLLSESGHDDQFLAESDQ